MLYIFARTVAAHPTRRRNFVNPLKISKGVST
jgi:hypothetical protein